MTAVRVRWLSKRTVPLHLAALVFVPGCAVAAWWQVTRAEDGNQLSYVYMVMWPVFGLLGLLFWWMLLHTDYDSVGLKGMRRQQALQHEQQALQREQQALQREQQTPRRAPMAAADSEIGAEVSTSPVGAGPVAEVHAAPPAPNGASVTPRPVSADDDPELAAYNARLAALSATGAKTWRKREPVVVRRAR